MHSRSLRKPSAAKVLHSRLPPCFSPAPSHRVNRGHGVIRANTLQSYEKNKPIGVTVCL